MCIDFMSFQSFNLIFNHKYIRVVGLSVMTLTLKIASHAVGLPQFPTCTEAYIMQIAVYCLLLLFMLLFLCLLSFSAIKCLMIVLEYIHYSLKVWSQ